MKTAGMLNDQVYAWRLSRIFTLAGKTKELMDEAGIEPRQLPPGVLIPLLEAASTAASEEIHDLFARLMASAVADDVYQHPIFRHALEQMNAGEARILAFFGNGDRALAYGAGPSDPRRVLVPIASIPDFQLLNLSSSSMGQIYVENLVRVGVLEDVLLGQAYDAQRFPDHIENDERFKRFIQMAGGQFALRFKGELRLTEAGKRLAAIAGTGRLPFNRPAPPA